MIDETTKRSTRKQVETSNFDSQIKVTQDIQQILYKFNTIEEPYEFIAGSKPEKNISKMLEAPKEFLRAQLRLKNDSTKEELEASLNILLKQQETEYPEVPKTFIKETDMISEELFKGVVETLLSETETN